MEWISVNERLPATGQKVYVRIVKDDVHIKDVLGTFNNGGFYYFENEKLFSSDYVQYWAEWVISVTPEVEKQVNDFFTDHFSKRI